MTPEEPAMTGVSYDTATELAHRLIRTYAHDSLDPFMIPGHPHVAEGRDRIVWACFYYTLIMTPKITLLLDNGGRGGMCNISLDEWPFAWKTGPLLDQMGTNYDQLANGTATLSDAEPPAPDTDLWARTLEPLTAPSERRQERRQHDHGRRPRHRDDCRKTRRGRRHDSATAYRWNSYRRCQP